MPRFKKELNSCQVYYLPYNSLMNRQLFTFQMPHEICLKHSTWPRSVQYKLRPCVDFLNLLKKTTLLLFHWSSPSLFQNFSPTISFIEKSLHVDFFLACNSSSTLIYIHFFSFTSNHLMLTIIRRKTHSQNREIVWQKKGHYEGVFQNNNHRCN